MQNFYGAGLAIPESALIGDPAEDEAILDALIVEGTAKIGAALDAILQGLPLPVMAGASIDRTLLQTGPDQILQAIDLGNPELRAAIESALVAGGVAGATRAGVILRVIDRPVKSAMYNVWAEAWAREQAGRLITAISETTRARVRGVLADWIKAGDLDIADLKRALSGPGLFGPARASLIATTEITAAYANGNFDAYEAAGLGHRPPPQDQPPAHPGCRCWVSVGGRGGSLYYVWYTAADDRVCEICQPRHAQSIGYAGPDRGAV